METNFPLNCERIRNDQGPIVPGHLFISVLYLVVGFIYLYGTFNIQCSSLRTLRLLQSFTILFMGACSVVFFVEDPTNILVQTCTIIAPIMLKILWAGYCLMLVFPLTSDTGRLLYMIFVATSMFFIVASGMNDAPFDPGFALSIVGNVVAMIAILFAQVTIHKRRWVYTCKYICSLFCAFSEKTKSVCYVRTV
jgi:hypothetical protein